MSSYAKSHRSYIGLSLHWEQTHAGFGMSSAGIQRREMTSVVRPGSSRPQ